MPVKAQRKLGSHLSNELFFAVGISPNSACPHFVHEAVEPVGIPGGGDQHVEECGVVSLGRGKLPGLDNLNIYESSLLCYFLHCGVYHIMDRGKS
jgi:hypothetical protein